MASAVESAAADRHRRPFGIVWSISTISRPRDGDAAGVVPNMNVIHQPDRDILAVVLNHARSGTIMYCS